MKFSRSTDTAFLIAESHARRAVAESAIHELRAQVKTVRSTAKDSKDLRERALEVSRTFAVTATGSGFSAESSEA